MPRAVSSFSRGYIISCKISGDTPSKCLESLNNMQSIRGTPLTQSIDTIKNIYAQFEREKSTETHYENNGRKNNYTQRQEEMIIEFVKENPNTSVRKVQQVKEVNNVGMSASKVCDLLNLSGLYALKIPSIMLITDPQKEERLRFAKVHSTRTRKWQRGLFSDECILKKGSIGNRFLWYPTRKDIETDKCNQLEKYDKERVHIWGLISSKGPLYLAKVERNLDQNSYINLLQEAFQFVGNGFLQDKIFQQGLASCHTSQKKLAILETQNIELFEWMPKDADISPIERVWAYIKDYLQKLNSQSIEEDDLDETEENLEESDRLFQKVKNILKTSKKIQMSITRMYESLQQKIQKIIKNKGNQINF